MAPKKNNITTLCIRCPDLESAEACPAGQKKKTVNDCSAVSSDLWPGFLTDNDVDLASLSLLEDFDKSKKLLKDTKSEHDDAKTVPIMENGRDKPKQFDLICQIRGSKLVNKMPVTKTMLEGAYQRIAAAIPSELQGAEQSQGASSGSPNAEAVQDIVPDFSGGAAGILASADVQHQTTSESSHRSQHKPYEQPKPQIFDSIALGAKIKPHFLPVPSSQAHPKTTNDGSLCYPTRPDFNSKPDAYQVLTNHFVVTLPKGECLYEYSITTDITTPISKPKMRMLILDMIESDSLLWSNKESIATDGKSKIVSSIPLYSSNHQIRVNNYQTGQIQGPPATAIMTLTPGKVHSCDGLREFVIGKNPTYENRGACDALNILLSKSLIDSNNEQIFQMGNNKIFYRPAWHGVEVNAVGESAGLIAVRGYFSSVRPTMGAVLLNVNKVTSAFFKAQPLTEYLDKFEVNGGFDLPQAMEHLKSLRVRIMFSRHIPDSNGDPSIDDERRRVKTIAGFGKIPKLQSISPPTDYGSNVWDHMSKKYGKHLEIDPIAEKYPTINVGSYDDESKKQYYLATQLSVVADQPYRGVLHGRVTEEMIKLARKTPAENMRAILNDGIPALGLDRGKLSSLGLSIGLNPVSVPARHIMSPGLRYGTQPIKFNGASWKPDSKAKFGRSQSFAGPLNKARPKVQFFRPSNGVLVGHLASWYVRNFIGMHAEVGLQPVELLNPKLEYYDIDDWSENGLEQLLRNFQSKGMHIAIIIFPRDDATHRSMYRTFRVVADLKLDLHTICFSEERMHKSLSRFRPFEWSSVNQPPEGALIDYIRNVCMKLNLRGGNHNHLLQPTYLEAIEKAGGLCQTLILGADVTHPTAGKHRNAPSIAAVVGSIDANFAVFPGSVRLNPSKQEWIEDMQMMVKERLTEWSSKNGGRLPARILYYRDGVGDSYYPNILDHEHKAIKLACSKALVAAEKKENDIPVTTVIVTKRHHVRFFPLSDAAANHKLKDNCAPGTMVETGITHPHFFDFYLQSQHITVGAAKPAHYFVLANEMNLKPKQLQDLTYHLCFIYGRSLNTVSYVPPAYYADRLCERARLYLQHALGDGSGITEESTEADMMSAAERVFRPDPTTSQIPWGGLHQGTMFWM